MRVEFEVWGRPTQYTTGEPISDFTQIFTGFQTYEEAEQAIFNYIGPLNVLWINKVYIR